MSIESFPTGQAKQPEKAEENKQNSQAKQEKLQVAFIDTSDAVESQARDIAAERMSASKEELKGFGGFAKKIWKHNLAEGYYRSKEINRAKAEIINSGNLYIGEGSDKSNSDQALMTTIDRFTSEYEESIHEQAGESKKVLGRETLLDNHLNLSVRDLIKDYASGSIDDQAFEVMSQRLVGSATGMSADKLKHSINHTSNLFEIARQSKLAVEHGASLSELDREVEIVVGKAKLGVRTESNYNTIDKIASKLSSSKLGAFVNESTINTGVAIAYCATAGLAKRAVGSRLASVLSFGGSALFAGALAGAKENVRLKDERSQHARDKAKGKEILNPDSARRLEMDQAVYNTVSAKALTEAMSEKLSGNIENLDDFKSLLSAVSAAEARINFSDLNRVDLISYSDFKSVELERQELDIARALGKRKLRESIYLLGMPTNDIFDKFYSLKLGSEEAKLRSGEAGIDAKDKYFNKLKAKKVAGAALKATLSGLAVGSVAQEALSYLRSDQVGAAEHLTDDLLHKKTTYNNNVTPLEAVRRLISGEKGPAWVSRKLPNGLELKMLDNVELVVNPKNPNEYSEVINGEVTAEHLKFVDGELDQTSREILKQSGEEVIYKTNRINQEVMSSQSPQEFIVNHEDMFNKIHRKFWYDNGTQIADQNELKLHFGGDAGNGLSADGRYVFDVSQMESGASSHQGVSASVDFKSGDFKMLLSLDQATQVNVVEVPIDSSGQINIDPESDIGKTFFKVENGQLKFIGKYMEIGRLAGQGADGLNQYEILSTSVGSGVNEVYGLAPKVIESHSWYTSRSIGMNIEAPVLIPLYGRRPLEKMTNPSRPTTSMAKDDYQQPLESNGADDSKSSNLEAVQEPSETEVYEEAVNKDQPISKPESDRVDDERLASYENLKKFLKEEERKSKFIEEILNYIKRLKQRGLYGIPNEKSLILAGKAERAYKQLYLIFAKIYHPDAAASKGEKEQQRANEIIRNLNKVKDNPQKLVECVIKICKEDNIDFEELLRSVSLK